MRVTPSLKQSYLLACDMPIPAWNLLQRGHRVTIAVDADAVTAFRRDGSGRTPLDRLQILREDLDDLSDLLDVPLGATPRTYGELFRFLTSKGVRIVANADALRARGIRPGELDPMVAVVGSAEFRALLQDVDALLPYEEVAVPHHSLFHGGDHGGSH
jgi:predicted peroxiredoxin